MTWGKHTVRIQLTVPVHSALIEVADKKNLSIDELVELMLTERLMESDSTFKSGR